MHKIRLSEQISRRIEYNYRGRGSAPARKCVVLKIIGIYFCDFGCGGTQPPIPTFVGGRDLAAFQVEIPSLFPIDLCGSLNTMPVTKMTENRLRALASQSTYRPCYARREGQEQEGRKAIVRCSPYKRLVWAGCGCIAISDKCFVSSENSFSADLSFIEYCRYEDNKPISSDLSCRTPDYNNIKKLEHSTYLPHYCLMASA